MDPAGHRMRTRFILNFTTGEPHPEVTGTSPENGVMNVSVTANITITFNLEMNRSATEHAISSTPGISGVFLWDKDSKVVTWDPDSDLAFNAKYTITIRRSAMSAEGANLATEYKFSFTTAPDTIPPEVVDTYPGDQDTVPRDAKIIIRFSERMNQSSLTPGAIRIVPGSIRETGWIDMMTVWFTADLEEGMTYTVTISPDARDLAGNKMKNEYKFSFTIGEESIAAMWNRVLVWIILFEILCILILAFILIRKRKRKPLENMSSLPLTGKRTSPPGGEKVILPQKKEMVPKNKVSNPERIKPGRKKSPIGS
jgi:hypothetical protein